MMRSRWNGQRALITCFDGVGLKRLSALSSENPAKVTNWKRRGVRGMCDPLTSPSMRCVNERRVLLLSTPANRPHFDLKQYSEGQTTDEKSVNFMSFWMYKDSLINSVWTFVTEMIYYRSNVSILPSFCVLSPIACFFTQAATSRNVSLVLLKVSLY